VILLGIADLHGSLRGLDAIASDLSAAEVVLLSGDLTHFGGEAEVARVIEAVRALNPNVLAVAGNCDPPEVDAYLTREGINLHGRSFRMGSLTLVGVGGSLPVPGHTPNEYSEEELESVIRDAVAGVGAPAQLALLAHQPPHGTSVDRVFLGRHVGSRAVRGFILEHRPLFCLTGHIHEARGTDQLGETWIVNPGPLHQGGYARIEVEGSRCRVEVRDGGGTDGR
jgi:Icc-related predicted phosphoesterase